ncbi:hypothetical protein [Kyrpidia spormannii]|uniref:hypothetical protein n=1 Tax=Kyrpidia spormannii TaxID=2055160 RepID=UPI0014727C14|nr:hypothetical protein [Kyrpidia spormannii]
MGDVAPGHHHGGCLFDPLNQRQDWGPGVGATVADARPGSARIDLSIDVRKVVVR